MVNLRVTDLYPIATPEGRQISYDVARPKSVAILEVDLVHPVLEYVVLNAEDLLVVFATGLVLIEFPELSTSTVTYGFAMLAEERNVVAVPEGVTKLRVKRLKADATVYIHEMLAWYDLGSQTALQSR